MWLSVVWASMSEDDAESCEKDLAEFGGLAQGGSHEGRKKWSDPKYILNILKVEIKSWQIRGRVWERKIIVKDDSEI